MDVQFGKRKMKLGDGENELGQLRDSAALLGDVAALKARMDEDGYLWLRGLLDREKVAAEVCQTCVRHERAGAAPQP